MSPSFPDSKPSAAARRTGLVLSGIGVLFLTLDTVLKLSLAREAVEGTTQLGYQAHVLMPLGILEAVLLVLYLVPQTSIFGALLWTGYLGGAIATHVRLENPLFTHILFPIYVALFLWGGLWMRDLRLRALLPIKRA